MKCYLGVGHEREEVASIDVGGYFGETALLHDLPIKVQIDQGADSTDSTCLFDPRLVLPKGNPVTTALLALLVPYCIIIGLTFQLEDNPPRL